MNDQDEEELALDIISFLQDRNAWLVTGASILPYLTLEDIDSFYKSNYTIAQLLDSRDMEIWRRMVNQRLPALIESGDFIRVYRLVRSNKSLYKIFKELDIWNRFIDSIFRRSKSSYFHGMQANMVPEMSGAELIRRVFNGYPNANPLWVLLSTYVYLNLYVGAYTVFGYTTDNVNERIFMFLGEDGIVFDFDNTGNIEGLENVKNEFAKYDYIYEERLVLRRDAFPSIMRRIYLLFKAGWRLNQIETQVFGYGSKAISSNVDVCFVCAKPAENVCSGCDKTMYCSKKCQKRDWNKHKVVC